MFDARWYKKVFIPLVKKAQSKGINPLTVDRFLEWCRKDYPEIRWFQAENALDWPEVIAECLAA